MSAESVLITGGAGFIGSALARRLSEEGHRVRMLDSLSPQVHGEDAPRTSATWRRAKASGELLVGSVTARADLQSALEGVDAVVHLAAETGTGQSMYEIQRYVDVNVGGTALLLDVLAKERHSVGKVVVASSRAVYGEGKYVAGDGTVFYPGQRDTAQLDSGMFDPVDPRDSKSALSPLPTDERSRLAPSSIYGITKLTQEQLVLTAANALDIGGVALRFQNVYGPGQALHNPYTGILSIFSTLLRQKAEINIFEDGLESRDFVYIDDVVAATRSALLSDDANGHAVNVGSGVATSVLEVVDQLEKVFRLTGKSRVSGSYRIGDIRHCVADLTLARELLGFHPDVSFSEGIAQFVDWMRNESPDDSGQYERSLEELRVRNLLK